MQRVSTRPTNLIEFNQLFPPQTDGHKHSARNAAGEHAPGREGHWAKSDAINDLQRTLSSSRDAALGKDSQRLLELARDLPLTLKNEPGLMDMCARRCLQAATHASLATREHVWMILRNALPSLPQPTAIALRDSLQAFHHHQPATVV